MWGGEREREVKKKDEVVETDGILWRKCSSGKTTENNKSLKQKKKKYIANHKLQVCFTALISELNNIQCA